MVIHNKIPSLIKIDDAKDYIIQKLNENNVDFDKAIIKNKISLKKAYATSGAREQLSILKKIASSHGGMCLSVAYVNDNTKLNWECAEGHHWSAIPSNIKRGQWCPQCGMESSVQSKRMDVKTICQLVQRS